MWKYILLIATVAIFLVSQYIADHPKKFFKRYYTGIVVSLVLEIITVLVGIASVIYWLLCEMQHK